MGQGKTRAEHEVCRELIKHLLFYPWDVPISPFVLGKKEEKGKTMMVAFRGKD